MNPLIVAGTEMAWHGFMRFLSVLVWTLVIAGLGWAVYAGIIRPTTKPNPTTRQEAQQIINYTLEPKQTFFGCANFRIEKPNENKDKILVTSKNR